MNFYKKKPKRNIIKKDDSNKTKLLKRKLQVLVFFFSHVVFEFNFTVKIIHRRRNEEVRLFYSKLSFSQGEK